VPVRRGAALINDVSAGTLDPDLLPTVAATGLPVCLMHLPVRPREMDWSRAAAANEPDKDGAFLNSVADFLRARVEAAGAVGICETNIVIFPAFGGSSDLSVKPAYSSMALRG
jgi:2-amino-4-hydroxy-6-hydroxymethyldihydropteridine diphosphokinase/dihydropteroate synthase